METIFSDNKILSRSMQPNHSFFNTSIPSIITPNALRFSVSPQKHKLSKRFFDPLKNNFAKKTSEAINDLKHQYLQNLILQKKMICEAPPKSTFQQTKHLKFPKIQSPERFSSNSSLQIKQVKMDQELIDLLIPHPRKRDFSDIGHKKIEVTNSTGENQQNGNSLKISDQSEEIVVYKNTESEKTGLSTVPKSMRKNNKSVVFNSDLKPQKSMKQIVPKAHLKVKQIGPHVSLRLSKQLLVYHFQGDQYINKINENKVKQVLFSTQKNAVTAKIYYVLNLQTLQPLLGLNQRLSIEIASLSKIMTCYLAILLCKKYEVNMKESFYRVPDKIQDTPGTSANLAAGDVINMDNLLYALMLPSGNDASVCIAQFLGKIIYRKEKKEPNKSYYDFFIEAMNEFSKQLGLKQWWNNSSGLSYNPNTSTAQAIVNLAALALQDPTFSSIVSTKEMEIEVMNNRYGLTRKIYWKNTNKLLWKGWDGVKTGATETAGNCLMAKHGDLLIGVFDCKTQGKRFSDSVKLRDFITQKFGSQQPSSI